MKNQPQETFEDVLFYYQTFGLEAFTAKAREKGCDLDEEFTLESLNEFERYIVQEKVTHISKDEKK